MIGRSTVLLALSWALALALAGVVWVGSGAAGWPADWRFLAVAGLLTLWGLATLFAQARRSSRPLTSATPEGEARAVRRALDHGREQLARAGIRGHRLYDRPWFLIMGAGGAGKSSTIKRAGLDLIAMPDEQGWDDGLPADPCTFWVAREAVFVEASGRHLAADLDPAAQAAGWRAQLTGLAAMRSLLPVNGVILTLCLGDLSLFDSIERERLARSLRQRLDEMEAVLGLRPPVYVFLTKLDLMPGFVDCFSTLEGSEREQAWGMSFAYDDLAGKPVIEGFAEQFSGLVGTLRDRVADLVLRAPASDRAARLHSLPAQIAYRLPVVDGFLKMIFDRGRDGKRPLLRGVYLTSATIDMLSIDELLPPMSRRFGFSGGAVLPPDIDPEAAEQGFFLAQPMRDVVLREAGLIARGRHPYRRRRLTLAAALGALAVVGGLSLTVMASSYTANLKELKTTQLEGDALARRPAGLSPQIGLLRLLEAAATRSPRPFPANPTMRVGIEPIDHFGPAAIDLDHGRIYRALLTSLGDRLINDQILPMLEARMKIALIDFNRPKSDLLRDLALYRQGADGALGFRPDLNDWITRQLAILLPEPSSAADRQFLSIDLGRRLDHGAAAWSLDGDFAAAVARRIDAMPATPAGGP